MKLAFYFNIVAQAAQSSNKISLTACDGQCNDPLATCTITDEEESGFVCNCPNGYSWIENSGHCEDIDECIQSPMGYTGQELCNGGQDGIAYSCVNLIGTFICACNSGFYLSGATECIDINECVDGTGCEYGCTNLIGSFECTEPSNPFPCECKLHIIMIRRLIAKQHMEM